MKSYLVFALILLAAAVAAYKVDGHHKSKDEFTLIGRFTFSKSPSAEKSKSVIMINETSSNKESELDYSFWTLYYDSSESWDEVHKNKSLTCMDKRLKYYFPVKEDVDYDLKPHDYVRPHIWYVVLLNCPHEDGSKIKLDVKYTVHFINQDGSEVGFDEEGMLPLNIFYFIVFLLVGVVHGVAVFFLWRKGVAHPIVLILAGVILLIIFSLFFVMIHWGVYSSNGVGSNGCRVFGQLLMGTANVIFAVLLIAIASGWAITYHDLPRKWQILIIGGVYFVIYLILFICINATGQTAASTQFVYAKGALLAFVIIYILACWLGVWGYFSWCLYRTYREEAQFDKRLFYFIFFIGATAWFVLPALLNFISMGIAEWYRPRVVDAFQLTVTFIGVVALVLLLWPTRVEKYFRISSRSDVPSAGESAGEA